MSTKTLTYQGENIVRYHPFEEKHPCSVTLITFPNLSNYKGVFELHHNHPHSAEMLKFIESSHEKLSAMIDSLEICSNHLAAIADEVTIKTGKVSEVLRKAIEDDCALKILLMKKTFPDKF